MHQRTFMNSAPESIDDRDGNTLAEALAVGRRGRLSPTASG